MTRLFWVACSLAALFGCASTDVPAPIVDRSDRPASAAPPTPPPAKEAAATPVKKNAAAEPPAAATKPPATPATPATQSAGAKPSANQQAASKPTATAAVVAPAAAPKSAESTETPAIRPYREGDWRPEYYVVKKGDTLYSIALDHGQDYRDLSAWNHLNDAAYIQVDQRLRLFPPGTAPDSTNPEPVALPPAAISERKPEPAAVPTFSEPKAKKLPYSDQAFAELTQYAAAAAKRVAARPTPTTATATATVTAKPGATPKTVQAGMSGAPDERLTWEWPTKGRLLYGFGEGANYKGVAIDGLMGQPVVASAPGKVVYSGSGLRGYGKLIIIKHNATYLSVYAHNSQLLVKEGQNVAQGQKIAEMGDTEGDGLVSLHFEIRRLGKPIDPLKYLPERSS
jgi:lipoprotein NlpD